MLISKSKTYVDDEVLSAADLNQSIDDIVTVVNGGLDQNNLAANAVGTSEIADDAVTLAKIANPYRVRVARSGSQTIQRATWTKVQLNAESYDSNNNFDAVTNFVYTVPVTGFYQVNGLVKTGGAKMTTIARVYTSAGAAYEGQASDNASYTDNYSVVSDIIELTAGQTVELQVYHLYSGAAVLTAASMSIHLLSV